MRRSTLWFFFLAATVVAVSGTYPLPTSNIYLWGANQNSCLGFGPNQCSVPLPLPVINSDVVLNSQISQVVSGIAHTITLLSDGSVFVMGDNSYGQLGVSPLQMTNSRSFVQVQLPEIVSVSAGDYYSLFLAADGSVFAAGDNSFGQLCFPSSTASVSPVSAIEALSGITKITAGTDHSLFVGSSYVFACGANEFGQLGMGSVSAFEDSLQQVSFSGSVVAVAAGNKFSVLLTSDGNIYGFGSNAMNQLIGVGSASVNVPTLLSANGLSQIVAVVAGANHLVMLNSNGQAFAAGSNAQGQLSDPQIAETGFSVLGGGFTVASISAGSSFTTLLTTDGRIFTVGDNSQGSLGIGSYSSSSVLQEVSGLSSPIHSLVSASPNSFVNGFTTAKIQLSSLSLEGGALLGVGVPSGLFINAVNIPVFYGALPLQISVSGPASASTSSVLLSNRGVISTPVLFSCINTGVAKIQVSSPFISAPLSLVATCYGSITVQFFSPTDVLKLKPLTPEVSLDGELEAVITLNPPAPYPIRLAVQSSLPSIARPSADRISFTTGASSRQITIISPLNGAIGISTFFVVAEQPGSYGVLTFNFTVQGSMSLTVPSCIDAAVLNVFTVTINPPSLGSVQIALASTNGLLSEAILTIPNGLSSGTFTLTGGRASPATISLRSSIYAPLDSSFLIKAGLKFSGPSNVLQGAPQNLSLTLIPNPPTSFQVSFTTSNVAVSPSSPLAFLPGKATQSLQLVAGSTGAASVTFSGSNFCSSTFSFNVGSSVLCGQGYSPDSTGKACALCPGNSVSGNAVVVTNSCSNFGSCSFSSCFSNTARCVCPSSAFGTACEFSTKIQVTAVSLTAIAVVANVPGFSQTIGAATLQVPANTIPKAQQIGTLYIAPLNLLNPFPGQIDPSTSNPTNTFSTEIGFSASAGCSDNTPITGNFFSSPTITIPVDPSVYSPTQLSQFTLYYWNGLKWRHASSLCTITTTFDITTNTITTNICQSGIYNFFLDPPPQAPANTGNSNQINPPPTDISGGHPMEGTTGITGVQPPAGPGPYFPPNTNYNPSNNASPLSFSFAVLLASVLASLLF